MPSRTRRSRCDDSRWETQNGFHDTPRQKSALGPAGQPRLVCERAGGPASADPIRSDQLVPEDHPIREIKPMVDNALRELSPTFTDMYAETGRPSIPPEHLLKACLLIALYSVRSERQFCERLRYDLLFKWFLDMNIIDPAFDAPVFSKNKERLLEHEVAREFLGEVLAEARRRELLSEDHFTVDGTLLEAWASLKSFRPRDSGSLPKGGEKNPEVDFHGEKRSNDTHRSTTDPEAMLAKKGHV